MSLWAFRPGGVAQMAEHMVCNHGVRGSSPLTSTISSSLQIQVFDLMRCLIESSDVKLALGASLDLSGSFKLY
jgi:hypothetical protein